MPRHTTAEGRGWRVAVVLVEVLQDTPDESRFGDESDAAELGTRARTEERIDLVESTDPIRRAFTER